MSGTWGSNWIDEVRERADLLEVVTAHTKLKRMGATWRGPCPLHGGSGPNFSVRPAKNTFKCFVCGEGGDVFTFLEKKDGMTFLEAARHLAGRLGIPVPEERPVRPTDSERSRSAQQSAMTAEREVRGWAELGLGSLVADFRLLGRATSQGDRLLLPVRGRTPDAPKGWIVYALDRGMDGRVQPVRLGFEAGSDPSAEHDLWLPPRFRGAALDAPCLLVDDPVVALRLVSLGHAAVLAPVGIPGPGAPWLSEGQVQRLADAGISAVAMVGPWGTPTDGLTRLRGMYATEPLLIQRGIEALVWLPSPASADGVTDMSGATSAWEWLDRFQTPEAFAAAVHDPESLVDAFQLRVAQMARRWARGTAGSRGSEGIEKLLGSLRAARASGDRALYHAYVSWTTRALGLNDRSRVARHLDDPPADRVSVF